MAVTDIVFDKLIYVDRLKSGGFSEEQARAQAEALGEALRETVATKSDIFRLESRIETLEAKVTGELRLVKWMLALVIAATVLPLVRDFLG